MKVINVDSSTRTVSWVTGYQKLGPKETLFKTSRSWVQSFAGWASTWNIMRHGLENPSSNLCSPKTFQNMCFYGASWFLLISAEVTGENCEDVKPIVRFSEANGVECLSVHCLFVWLFGCFGFLFWVLCWVFSWILLVLLWWRSLDCFAFPRNRNHKISLILLRFAGVKVRCIGLVKVSNFASWRLADGRGKNLDVTLSELWKTRSIRINPRGKMTDKKCDPKAGFVNPKSTSIIFCKLETTFQRCFEGTVHPNSRQNS